MPPADSAECVTDIETAPSRLAGLASACAGGAGIPNRAVGKRSFTLQVEKLAVGNAITGGVCPETSYVSASLTGRDDT